MRVVWHISIIAATLTLSSCGGVGWPPFHASLEEQLRSHESSFLALENQLRSDGFARIPQRVLAQTSFPPSAPKVDEGTVEYCKALVDAIGMYIGEVYIEEKEATFSLIDQIVEERKYFLSFVHYTGPATPWPDCTSAQRTVESGRCEYSPMPSWGVRASWYEPPEF